MTLIEPSTAFTPSADRPERPRSVRTMIVPLLIAVTGMVLGAAAADLLYGALWGLIGAGGVALALRIGRQSLDGVDIAIIGIGVVSSTVLAVQILPAVPERVDVALVLRFGAAWLPAGVAGLAYGLRRGLQPTTALNIAIAWVASGLLALPAGEAFDVIHPASGVLRGREAVFGRGDYMIIALVIGLIGIAALLAGVSRLPLLATGSTVLFMTAFAGAQVGFSIPVLIENLSNILNIPNFWPPDFGWAIGDGQWWWPPSWEFGAPRRANPIVETVRIAIVSTVVGCTVALPVAFLASTITAPGKIVYLVDKGFMNLIRTIPDLFWALLFVIAVTGGPFAGALALTFFSLAIMAKLLSETIDAVDPGPLEAAKATGSSHFPAVRASVFPQVLPNYVAYALYIFELNIRASVVIGLVGAGGIGRVVEAQRSFFLFDRVVAVVILIFVIVFVIEQASIAIRRRLV